jgi:hypothetical protein
VLRLIASSARSRLARDFSTKTRDRSRNSAQWRRKVWLVATSQLSNTAEEIVAMRSLPPLMRESARMAGWLRKVLLTIARNGSHHEVSQNFIPRAALQPSATRFTLRRDTSIR